MLMNIHAQFAALLFSLCLVDRDLRSAVYIRYELQLNDETLNPRTRGFEQFFYESI